MFMNETISRTKYIFQNESIRKVRNESIRKVGTKYSRTNKFFSLGAECIVQLSLLLSFKRCLVPYCIIAKCFIFNVMLTKFLLKKSV